MNASFSAPAPIARRVRAYFAPVNRVAGQPVFFDPSQQGAFDLASPPAPWISLGFIQGFTRKSLSLGAALGSGTPAAAAMQVRESVGAEVSLQFLAWTKLTMALATGSQHMNLLAPATGTVARADGAPAVTAVAVQTGSSATSIAVATADAARFAPGQFIAVDCDYCGQTGYLGSPIAGAYLRQPLNDPDYMRRITFNVGLVTAVKDATLTLADPLPCGIPPAGAKVQVITGFVDREGGSFHHEFSALFVMEGAQGERIFFHYPRLQPMISARETSIPLVAKGQGRLDRIVLDAQFLALPVADPLDNERIVCYRSFLPAANSLI